MTKLHRSRPVVRDLGYAIGWTRRQPNASMGMSMTINYAGISTPYTMGSSSGNVPE